MWAYILFAFHRKHPIVLIRTFYFVNSVLPSFDRQLRRKIMNIELLMSISNDDIPVFIMTLSPLLSKYGTYCIMAHDQSNDRLLETLAYSLLSPLSYGHHTCLSKSLFRETCGSFTLIGVFKRKPPRHSSPLLVCERV